MREVPQLRDAAGNTLARENLLVALFCKCPFSDIVEGARECVEQYLKIIPEYVLKWTITGVSSGTHKEVTPKSVSRCLSMLTVTAARKKDVHFRLLGEEKYAPDYQIVVNGYKSPSEIGFLNQTNMIEMRFPSQLVLESDPDELVETASAMFSLLPWDSGYAARALCFGMESRYKEAGAYMVPLAFRSHGFDVPNNLPSSSSLGTRCRGARWLTMLSDDLVSEIGGADSVREAVVDSVEIRDASQGIVIRAGDSPETGDVNRNQRTPLVASVARAIENVTYFHENSLLPLFGHDAEKRDRWERRFWPHEEV